MTPTSLPAAGLPRARCLTDALLAQVGRPPSPAALEVVRARLVEGIVADAPRSGVPVRIDHFRLGALGSTPTLGDTRPFSWSPRAARRQIALAALRVLLRSDARTPAEAVTAAVAKLAHDGRAGLGRRGSPAAWLATLPAGALAAVMAEATTWATHLYCSVEWDRLERPFLVGPPDRWWDCPRTRVGLRGRVDVRVDRREAGSSLLTVSPGRPRPTARVELALAALVDVASRPTARPPARVVGWWPDCGRAVVLPVDATLLSASAQAVVTAVRRTTRPRPRPSPVEMAPLGVAA